MSKLYSRAGIDGMTVYDLRPTFAKLATAARADEFVVMRLLRDTIPGVGSRYIKFPPDHLVIALKRYSPIVQVSGGEDAEETASKAKWKQLRSGRWTRLENSEGGGGASPRPEETEIFRGRGESLSQKAIQVMPVSGRIGVD